MTAELNNENGDPLGLQIDVSDLEGKWLKGPQPYPHSCAMCGEVIPEDDVPLVFWRKEGNQMLVLHFECAQKRMRPKVQLLRQEPAEVPDHFAI